MPVENGAGVRACFSYPRVLTGRLQGFIRSLDPEIIIQPQRTKYKRLQTGFISPEGARILSNANSTSPKFPSKPTELSVDKGRM